MWLDHVTLALRRMEALDDMLTTMGLARHQVPALFSGTERSIVPLDQSFIELVAVSNPRDARRWTLGRALLRFLSGGEGIFRVVAGVPDLDGFIRRRLAIGAHYWPPIEETLTGIGENPRLVRLTQMDPMMPWILEYQGERPGFSQVPGRVMTLDVQSDAPAMTAIRYAMALGVPLHDAPGGIKCMAWENCFIQFSRGAYTGYGGMTLETSGHRAIITAHHHALSTVLQPL